MKNRSNIKIFGKRGAYHSKVLNRVAEVARSSPPPDIYPRAIRVGVDKSNMWDEPNPPLEFLQVEFTVSTVLATLIGTMMSETKAGFTKTVTIAERMPMVRFAFDVGVHADPDSPNSGDQYVVDCLIQSPDPFVLFPYSIGMSRSL